MDALEDLMRCYQDRQQASEKTDGVELQYEFLRPNSPGRISIAELELHPLRGVLLFCNNEFVIEEESLGDRNGGHVNALIQSFISSTGTTQRINAHLCRKRLRRCYSNYSGAQWEGKPL